MLVLNGSREGLFFAAITAARYVGARATASPAILMPNPFYPAYGAGARAAGCEAIYLPTTPPTVFCPISMRSMKRRWRARWQSSSPRPPIRRARWLARLFHASESARRPPRLHDFERRVLFGNLHAGTRPAACWNAPGPISATWWRSNRCRSARTCRACASALPPATSKFLSRLPRTAQRRRAAGAGAAAAGRGRRLQRRGACRGEPRLYRIKFDLADQILGNRYGYRQAGRRLLRLARRLRPWRRRSGNASSSSETPACAWCPEAICARQQSDGSNPGAGYIRLALVQDSETTAEALHRLVQTLD